MTLSKSALLASFIFTGVLAGCGGDDDGGGNTVTDTGGTVNDTATSDTGGGSDTATGDTGGGSDTAAGDTAATDGGTDGGSDTGGDGAGGVTLTVQNYLSWCTVAVNGGATSTTGTQTVTVPSGTSVSLVGDTANSTFEWGYWVLKASGATHDTSKTKSVTVTANTTIQACCPFAAGAEAHAPCPAP